jgi:3-phosphoshikimate 1-carboxyvinyltransferase
MKRIEEQKKPLAGEIIVPGDKSIGHRAVIFASIARGTSRIYNLSGGEDNRSTVGAFKSLGVRISEDGGVLSVEGKGWEGLAAPEKVIDCGNSGTTMRLLSGVLAGRPFASTLDGDASLRQRPMQRVIEPLSRMGARIESRGGKGCAPLEIHGGGLKAIRYATPMASAQVKSAIILAGLQADGITIIEEPQQSRDHTEVMARAFGAKLEVAGRSISVAGGHQLSAADVRVPGDLSSAAFFMVAAAAVPGSDLLIRDVGCNPTRSGVIDVLRRMGVAIEFINPREEAGEPVADIRVRGGKLKGVDIGPEMVARTIDEYPVLAVAGALAEGKTTICGA